MQPITNNLVQRGFLNRFAVAIAATLNFFLLVSAAAGEQLCKEEMGAYYVNVGVANTTFGTGIDDAFEATIQRVRPTSEAEVDRLKNFFYFDGKDPQGNPYSDNRQYHWLKEGGVYRLFKKVPGRRDVRVEVFTVTFPPAKKQQFLMRIMNSNPALYAEMNLSSRLGVLGVMGVAVRGRSGTVDFINNLQVDLAGASLPKAYVGNADTMLYRFALEQGYEGVDSEIDQAEWKTPRVVATVLSKKNEQFFLDNLPQFYKGLGLKDDREEVMNRFGSIEVPGGIKLDGIRYVYLNCIPSGDSTHGSPKSAFVPLKVQEGGGIPYYPVFIFPSAFGTLDTLHDELRRASLHVRWWNAVANLSAHDHEHKDLREALLRSTTPYIEWGIVKSPNPEKKSVTSEYNVPVSLRAILVAAVEAALNDPAEPVHSLPWNIDTRVIMVEGAGSGSTAAADGFYNNLFRLYMPDITAFKKSDKYITLKKKKERERVARALASAVANGYLLSAPERTTALKAVLGSPEPYLELVSKWKNLDSQKQTALELIDKIKGLNFAYDDLDWLKRLTEYNMPLKSLANDPVGIKLVYLADTLKNKKLKDLDLKLADPMVIDDTLDQDALSALVASVNADAATALNSLAQKTAAQVAGIDAVKARMQAIQGELETLKNGLPAQYDAKAAAETAADDAVSPKKKLRDDSYEAMKSACTSGSKSFSPSLSEHDMVLYRTVWDYYYGDDAMLAACTPKVNVFADARKEYKAIVEQHRQSVAEKGRAIEESLEKIILLKEELTRLSNSITGAKAGIAVLNRAIQEKNFTWKSWIERSFEEYFLSNDGAGVAYDKLVKKLGKAGVTAENRP